jgi:hypothetical protein
MQSMHRLIVCSLGLGLFATLSFLTACGKKCPPGYGLVGDGCKPVLAAGAAGSPAEAGTPTAAGAPSEGARQQAQARDTTRGTGTAGSAPRSMSANSSESSPPTTGGTGGTGDAGSADSENASSASDVSQATSGPCAGQQGGAVCDGAVLHTCNDVGESANTETCGNDALCQVGAAVSACAQCVPDTFLCEAEKLKQCSLDGQWVEKETCASAALCQEAAGACTEMVCMPDMPTCSSDGSTLRVCNSDGSDFAQQQPCGAGLCDASAGRCNKCMPGSKTCSGNALTTCSTDGQEMTATECVPSGGDCSTATCRNSACVPGIKPISSACSGGKCDATGRCVACITSSDCPDAGPCNDRTCSLGVCGSRPKAEGTPCQTNGMMCDGRGACISKPCGNGVLDQGEVCETSGPDAYDRGTCDGDTCTLEPAIYARCQPMGLCPSGSQGWLCGASNACTHLCASAEQCRAGSLNVACMAVGNDGASRYCVIRCGTDGDCPNSLRCIDYSMINPAVGKICGST